MLDSTCFHGIEKRPSYPTRKLIIGDKIEGDCLGCGREKTFVMETYTAEKDKDGYTEARMYLCQHCLQSLIGNHSPESKWIGQFGWIFTQAAVKGRLQKFAPSETSDATPRK